MAFELIEIGNNRAAPGPMFQLRPDGVMRFNVKATQELRNLGADRALVFWDKETRKIAFAPSTDAKAYKVAYNRRGNGAQVVVRIFPRHAGLTIKAPIRVSVCLQETLMNGGRIALLVGEIGSEFLLPPTDALVDSEAVKRSKTKGQQQVRKQ